MSRAVPPAGAHAVGIDLGTTYSCISYLTPQGQPVTVPNQEGELTTPSVVLFEGDEPIVGTEALRNAVAHPTRVVQHAKRYIGDPNKTWVIDGVTYRPEDVSAVIVHKLLKAAEDRLGGPIKRAVITVPAQFNDIQRQKTAEAGRKAGLERVDIINEPVAASLCYVLGEGMWFAELANDQTVMVFDLGGGTFDLSLVRYNKDKVTVVASGGDLRLGGLDWNKALETFACDVFVKETSNDPRLDLESMQALSLEIEQSKRSLSVRNKALITLQHAGRRKAIEIERLKFEQLTSGLVSRLEDVTRSLLKAQKMGWARIDAVLITGGSTRMPMVRDMLKRVSGTTINATLSPDQSISHGAAYYAGMLLSGEGFATSILSKETTSRLARFTQQSVCARGLGILVRDTLTGERIPHYIIAANTPLPCAFKQTFGTVVPNQRRVHLHIVESGTSPDQPYVSLGECVVDDLPAGLPELSPIEVTIWYDEQARVRVSAIEPQSGLAARATLVRPENLATREAPKSDSTPAKQPLKEAPKPVAPTGASATAIKPAAATVVAPRPAPPKTAPAATPPPVKTGSQATALDRAERPIPLCNECGEPLDGKGRCVACGKMFSFTAPVNTFRPTEPGQTPSTRRRPPSDPHTAQTEPMLHLPPEGKPAPKRRS
jgi:molecular chaperone DnaK